MRCLGESVYATMPQLEGSGGFNSSMTFSAVFAVLKIYNAGEKYLKEFCYVAVVGTQAYMARGFCSMRL
ncbi:unnamed protein product [Sphenostylis stenocarpa]|uniref:Uncharacterized protein n=1 Tax=Sphenostylis stenocarpa TaxID=92480 RepID=A0AA86VG21_9FABA|nr:unnamed protein product [Sphenostylis stenocarpa]